MPRGSHFHISLVANQQFWHSKIDMRTLLSGFEMTQARLAQSVEHQTLNLRVKGSSPLLGTSFSLFFSWQPMKSDCPR